MYIAKIKITNFRNFIDQEIEFNDGVNVIIGHNNAGKTNLLKALSLVFDYQGKKRLDTDDFNKYISFSTLKVHSPTITVSAIIKKGASSNDDDLVTISTWLTKLETEYEALLTYEFFLPEKHEEEYARMIGMINEESPNALDSAWKLINHEFIRLYTYKIWGGEVTNKNQAEGDALQKFDFQFLAAIRDVERDLLTGQNIMLREVLHFFLDYDIKSDLSKSKNEQIQEIKTKKECFKQNASSLLSTLHTRMEKGKEQILSYAQETGASFNNAKPHFDGAISDVEMLSVLRLVIEHTTGIKIPATHNGLGYNNLIFMSLLLAKMQVNANGDYLGSNAKVFSTLAIEEPEAHLHPAMQYKFLKFLKNNKDQKQVRQIFITTHSTHITAAVELDEIICLHNEGQKTLIGYPGKVFPTTTKGNESKKYVQRFLDATKSDMLFAQKVILVEGLAEQLLMSTMAKYLNKSLEDNHVAVINVGGRYFNHFLYLFDNSQNLSAIPKKIVCITDRDPAQKETSNNKANYKECYPFEYKQDINQFQYKDNATDLINTYQSHLNIQFYSQDEFHGKTFEYDLVWHNPNCELLLTDSIANQDEIREMMKLDESRNIDDYFNVLSIGTENKPNEENKRIRDGLLNNTTWTETDKKKAVVAARYLNSVKKGENALELAYVLEENLNKDSPYAFEVPQYIKDAIEWICQ